MYHECWICQNVLINCKNINLDRFLWRISFIFSPHSQNNSNSYFYNGPCHWQVVMDTAEFLPFVGFFYLFIIMLSGVGYISPKCLCQHYVLHVKLSFSMWLKSVCLIPIQALTVWPDTVSDVQRMKQTSRTLMTEITSYISLHVSEQSYI